MRTEGSNKPSRATEQARLAKSRVHDNGNGEFSLHARAVAFHARRSRSERAWWRASKSISPQNLTPEMGVF